MVVCADTSFLLSLYGNDTHTPKARAWARGSRRPIRVSLLADYELGNALRFAQCRGLLADAEAERFWTDYAADCAAGRIIVETCNLAAVVGEAMRLSAAHTRASGYRGFDILHVAAALVLRADVFLTFNAAQRELALAEDLPVSL